MHWIYVYHHILLCSQLSPKDIATCKGSVNTVTWLLKPELQPEGALGTYVEPGCRLKLCSESPASPSSSSQYWVAEGVTVLTPDSEGTAVINLVCPENSRSNRWLKSGRVPSIILGINVVAAKQKTSLLKEALGAPLESCFQVCAKQDFRRDKCR